MNNKQEEKDAINEANRMTASSHRACVLARLALAKARDNLSHLETTHEKAWHAAFYAAVEAQAGA